MLSYSRFLLEKLDPKIAADYQHRSHKINDYAATFNAHQHDGNGRSKVALAHRHLRSHIKGNEPTKEATILYHGTSHSPKSMGADEHGNLRTKSFLSTSTDEKTGTNHATIRYSNHDGAEGHLLHIKVRAGHRISDKLSSRESANHENEHLIADRARLKVDPKPFKTTQEKYAFKGKSHTTTVHHWNASLEHDGVTTKS